MQDRIIEKINQAQEKKRPPFVVGDRVSVSVRLKEGDKERIQIFRGVVVVKQPKSGKGPGATFTVRKISAGVGVERIFPIHSPFIEKIEIETSSDVRRSRLYFLRRLTGKKARLKEAERFGEDLGTSAVKVQEDAVEAAPAEAEVKETAEAKPSKKEAKEGKAKK